MLLVIVTGTDCVKSLSICIVVSILFALTASIASLNVSYCVEPICATGSKFKLVTSMPFNILLPSVNVTCTVYVPFSSIVKFSWTLVGALLYSLVSSCVINSTLAIPFGFVAVTIKVSSVSPSCNCKSSDTGDVTFNVV